MFALHYLWNDLPTVQRQEPLEGGDLLCSADSVETLLNSFASSMLLAEMQYGAS